MSSERDAQNRKLAEWLEPTRSLDGFCICSASGQRIRERDFDSREEAQRYIDAEDERLIPMHKSTAHGVNIQPCIKTHPNFFTSEDASAMLLEKMRRPLFVSDWPGCEGWRVDIGTEPMKPIEGFPNAIGGKLRGPTHADRKTAIALAALALLEAEAHT